MPDLYGVTASDIAAELPGFFSAGFTQATKPTLATVTSWITDADTYIDTVVQQVTAVNQDLAESAGRLARRWIIADVKDRIREATLNLTTQDLIALRQNSPSAMLLERIQALGASEITAQLAALEEATLAAPRIAVSTTGLPTRSLVIEDEDLDGGNAQIGSSDLGAESTSSRPFGRGRF